MKARLASGWNGAVQIAGVKPLRKVLFFGCSMSRSRCTAGLVEALRGHGLQVKWINMATLRRWLGEENSLQWVRRVHQSFDPDLVFVFFRGLPQELLAELRHKTPTVLWVEEALECLDASQTEFLRRGHLLAMSNPGRFASLSEQGVDNMMFLMSGFSPRFHYPIGPRPMKRDVAFIGGPGSHSKRADLLQRISSRFKTEVFGPGWKRVADDYPTLAIRGPVRPRGYREICATSRIVLGINEINDEEFYFSNRTWLTLGCGAFHLTHYVPRLGEVFENGKHLAWFSDADDCMRQIDFYLAHDEERQRIARAGHEYAMEHHQYYNRVGVILDRLSGLSPASLNGAIASPGRLPEVVLRPLARGHAESPRISTTP